MDNYKGFYKVDEDGGVYVCATFYNPQTNETFRTCVRDYDYEDGSRDNDELYYLPLNKGVAKGFFHRYGQIFDGDEIVVVRGRKMLGERKRVTRVYDFIPEHFRGWRNQSAYAVEYLYFTDGTKCASKNCELAVKEPKPLRVTYEEVSKRPE